MGALNTMTTTQEYVIWLRGYLEGTGQELTNSQVSKIKDRLNDIFEHVAEPPKQTLQQLGETLGFTVHEGFPPKQFSEKFRC